MSKIPALPKLLARALSLAVMVPALAAAEAPAAKIAASNTVDFDRSVRECVATGDKIAAANRTTSLTLELVQTHFARVTGQCYVLLTYLGDGGGAEPTYRMRVLYRGRNQQVLAIVNERDGRKSGTVLDTGHVPHYDRDYEDALGYITGKMAFD